MRLILAAATMVSLAVTAALAGDFIVQREGQGQHGYYAERLYIKGDRARYTCSGHPMECQTVALYHCDTGQRLEKGFPPEPANRHLEVSPDEIDTSSEHFSDLEITVTDTGQREQTDLGYVAKRLVVTTKVLRAGRKTFLGIRAKHEQEWREAYWYIDLPVGVSFDRFGRFGVNCGKPPASGVHYYRYYKLPWLERVRYTGTEQLGFPICDGKLPNFRACSRSGPSVVSIEQTTVDPKLVEGFDPPAATESTPRGAEHR